MEPDADKMNRDAAADPLLSIEDREIAPQEREEVMGHIERLMAASRAPLGEERLRVDSRRSGALFPVLVNVAAVLLVAGGGVLLGLTFRSSMRDIALRSSSYSTGESTLVAAVRAQSESRLQEKEEEIGRVREDLSRISQETQLLKSQMEARIREREQELKESLSAELGSERERLRGQGMARAEVEARLSALQTQRQAEATAELEGYRRDLERALAEKERELSARYDEQRQSLEQESQAASRRLQALAELRSREELFTDQILGAYSQAGAYIQAGRYQEARRALEGLRSLLEEPAVEALPAVLRRRGADLLVIQALQGLLARGEALTGSAGGAQAAPPAGAAAPGGESGTVLAERDRRNDELAGRLADREGRVAKLTGQVAERDSRIAELAAEAEAQDRQIEALRGRLQEAERRLQEGQRALAGKEDRIGELSAQLQRASSASAGSLQDARGEIDRLKRDNAGLSARVADLQEQLRRQRSAREELQAREGREAALKDVMLFLTYLGGTSSEQRALQPKVVQQTREDPLYSAVVNAIQELLTPGAGGGAGQKLLGTVSLVAGDRVTVEPLVDLPVETGTPVQIRRIMELGRQVAIASGTVLSAESRKITVRIDRVEQAGTSPGAMDMVYIGAR